MNRVKSQITGTSGRRFGKCPSFKKEFRMLRNLEVGDWYWSPLETAVYSEVKLTDGP